MEETLACFCNACSKELGQFKNAFNVIGNNYYTPVYPLLPISNRSGHGFIGTGDVRPSKLGEFETCFLQNLNCNYCQVFLGVRCDSAPTGHILKKHQLLLRLSEITTLLAGTNQKAQISVRNAFILESADSTAAKRSKSRAPSLGTGRLKSITFQPAKSQPSQSPHTLTTSGQPRPLQPFQPPPTKPMTVTPSQLQHSQPSQYSESSQFPRFLQPSQPQPTTFKHSDAMPRQNSTPPKHDTSSASPVSLAQSGFEVWAEKVIKDQRQDIDRISRTVDRIEKTMDEMEGFMEEFRSSYATTQEEQKIAASSRQIQHTAIVNQGSRIDAFEQSHEHNQNAIGLLNANTATKDNVSRLATLVENIGQKTASSLSLLNEEFQGMTPLRTELNTLKTKVTVLEASTKKMRADASNTEIARLRNEAGLHNKISELSNAKGAELSKLGNGQGLHSNIPRSPPTSIPMQRALAGDSASSSAPYQTYGSAQLTPLNLMHRPGSQIPAYSAPSLTPGYATFVPSYGLPIGMQSSRLTGGRYAPQTGSTGQSYASVQPRPVEPVREQAHVNRNAIHGPLSHKPASTLHGSLSRNAFHSRRASTPPYVTAHAYPSPRTIYEREIAPAARMMRAVSAAVQLRSSSRAVTGSSRHASPQENTTLDKGNAPVHEPTPVNTQSQEVVQVNTKALSASKSQEERPAAKLPSEFNKSIVRVEIGPLNMDQFPPIKKPDQINSAALSSPEPSDSESDVSSIPATAKRKRTEPLSDHKGKRRAISPVQSSQPKRRKVSEVDTEATPRLESPDREPERVVIDLGSSDNDEPNSPGLFVDDHAIQSIETQEADSPVPMLDQDTHDLVSMLNRVAKKPYRKRRSSVQDNESASSGSKERQLMPSGPAAGPSVEKFRSHLQDFAAPIPPALKFRKALEQAARHELSFDTPGQGRPVAVMQSSHNSMQRSQEVPLATPEQIENPFKCGICLRRFGKSAGLKNHKYQSPACRADTSRDEVPDEFICSGCEGSFASLHLFNKHQCTSLAKPADQTDAWIADARGIVEEEERKKRLARQRDQTASTSFANPQTTDARVAEEENRKKKIVRQEKEKTAANPVDPTVAWGVNAKRTAEEEERKKRLVSERDRAAKEILDGWMN